MASPFAGFDNATLRFPTSAGGLERDGSGNMRAIAGPEIIVLVNLKQLSLQSALDIVRQPGVNDEALLLRGWCVEPMILPVAILAGTWAIAVWAETVGHFYLNSPINPPYGREGIGAITEVETGTKISGWFQRDR